MNIGRDEINRLCTPFITKAYNTLEFMLKELLQEENFMLEFDKIYMNVNFNGLLSAKLNYLMDRMKSMFRLREDILEYLFRVHEREVRF